MKKVLLLVTLLLATSSFGWASACGAGNLGSSSYGLSGFSCTEGNLQFSNFSYTSAGTVSVPGSAVAVTPVSSGGEVGFQFNAPFSVGGGNSADGTIDYAVTALSGSITDVVLQMAGFFDVNGGTATVDETVQDSGGNTLASLGVFDISFPGGVPANLTQSTDSANFAANTVFVGNLTKDIAVNGNGGVAGVSQVTNEFSTSSGVPEPGSMMLLGSGLMTLAGYVRRRQRKASK